jgi:hypothetical protein
MWLEASVLAKDAELGPARDPDSTVYGALIPRTEPAALGKTARKPSVN